MKYMGSKSRIADELVPTIQSYMALKNITAYIEPFCGGCNVIDKIGHKNRIASDVNEYLIGLLTYVRDGGILPETVTKEEYNYARHHRDEFEKWYIGAVGFLAGYNGRFYDGCYANPGVEVVNGVERYRDYYRESKDNILEQAPRLAGIEFRVCDYKAYEGTKGALIYCDPPYKGTQDYSAGKGFDHKEFWQTMRNWSADNIVLISEEWAPPDFSVVWQKEVSRSIDADNKSTVIEKLFIYGDNGDIDF